MFHNLYQLWLQLKRENLHGVNVKKNKDCLQQLRTQFKNILPPKGYRDLLENLDTLEAVIHRAVITYGRLQLQSQDVQINPVQAVDDSLIVSKSSRIESENNNALSTSVNETQLQQHEKSSRTKSDKHDTSSNLRTYITHDVDADIRLVNDQVPFAEDAEHDQVKSPLLKAEFLKTNDMVEKEVYNELSNRFLQLEKHCISLEISIQQKEESFQSNKPCKNQDSPEFREFFEINELGGKAQQQSQKLNDQTLEGTKFKNVHEKRISLKESYGSNDMVHAYFLEEARKMTQNKTRIPSHKDMASTRAHCTPNACTPKPRNIYRILPVSSVVVECQNVSSS
ncbi:hypothetical protein Tco_1440099 [Tanacetum coccineum]